MPQGLEYLGESFHIPGKMEQGHGSADDLVCLVPEDPLGPGTEIDDRGLLSRQIGFDERHVISCLKDGAKIGFALAQLRFSPFALGHLGVQTLQAPFELVGHMGKGAGQPVDLTDAAPAEGMVPAVVRQGLCRNIELKNGPGDPLGGENPQKNGADQSKQDKDAPGCEG